MARAVVLHRYLHSLSDGWMLGQVPGDVDADITTKQLKYLGVMETIRIRNQGYPVQHCIGSVLYRIGSVSYHIGSVLYCIGSVLHCIGSVLHRIAVQ